MSTVIRSTMSTRLSVKEYLIQNCPEEYQKILEETREEARITFESLPDILQVNVPFLLPMTANWETPTFGYITYDRSLNEI